MILTDEVRVEALEDQVDLLETLWEFDGHLCERSCVDGDGEVEVYYVFNTELYEKFGQVWALREGQNYNIYFQFLFLFVLEQLSELRNILIDDLPILTLNAQMPIFEVVTWQVQHAAPMIPHVLEHIFSEGVKASINYFLKVYEAGLQVVAEFVDVTRESRHHVIAAIRFLLHQGECLGKDENVRGIEPDFIEDQVENGRTLCYVLKIFDFLTDFQSLINEIFCFE